MIKTRRDLSFYIAEDYKRNVGKRSVLSYWVRRLCDSDDAIAFRYLKCLRKYEYYLNNKSGGLCAVFMLYYKWKHRKLSVKYGIVIGPNMVGYGFRMAHVIGGGIVINCLSMGNNCSANVGVLVGNNGGQDRRPIIGNNVSLSTGCKVTGKVVIGDNVIVCPNSVVVKDIPNNSIVSGVPAVIINEKD